MSDKLTSYFFILAFLAVMIISLPHLDAIDVVLFRYE